MLKEGQDDPSGYPAEANPDVLPWARSFEEMQEDIHGEGVDEVIAEDAKGPDEGPAVRVQLGRGHVNFGKEFPLKAGEREALSDVFEHRLVKEKEWLPTV